MIYKITFCAAVLIALLCILTACGKNHAEAAIDAAQAYNSRQDTKSYTGYGMGMHEETSQKFIATAYLELKTADFERSTSSLNELMGKYGAHSSAITIHENSKNYTLKVPVQEYKLFLEELLAIGKIIRLRETTEDVSRQYYDLESRLNARKTLLKTYIGYLEKTKNIEEILAVEEKIAELQAEFDDTGQQFRNLNNAIDYLTVQLELLGPVSAGNYNRETSTERIRWLISGFGNYLSIILVVLVGIVIYGIPALIILFALYFLLLGRIGLLKKIYNIVSKQQ
ncbi:MAG: DUF4349 domain-containing protein [Spirochaetaceae bacterium]|jgi:hypothetical protein|nr:DUF4349 domain-containing protein [Spirochaetaceae bacterium]